MDLIVDNRFTQLRLLGVKQVIYASQSMLTCVGQFSLADPGNTS